MGVCGAKDGPKDGAMGVCGAKDGAGRDCAGKCRGLLAGGKPGKGFGGMGIRGTRTVGGGGGEAYGAARLFSLLR